MPPRPPTSTSQGLILFTFEGGSLIRGTGYLRGGLCNLVKQAARLLFETTLCYQFYIKELEYKVAKLKRMKLELGHKD